MVELEMARRLEGVHLAALRVYLRHHVLDDPVLSRRIQSLQDDKDGPTVLGIEPLLQVAETLGASGEQFLGVVLADVEPRGVARVDVGEAEFAAVLDAIAFDDVGWEHGGAILSSRLEAGDSDRLGWAKADCRRPPRLTSDAEHSAGDRSRALAHPAAVIARLDDPLSA